MVKSKCVQCSIETAQTYFKKDGTGPICYTCMQASGEYPAISVLGDGTKICAVDKYDMKRHDGKGFYKDDIGRLIPCGMFPDYSSRDAPPRKQRDHYWERADILAELEVSWWRGHHVRDETAIINALTEQYVQLFRMPREKAQEAARLKLDAGKEHDVAEQLENLKCREQAEPHWNKAKEYLKKHFDIILRERED